MFRFLVFPSTVTVPGILAMALNGPLGSRTELFVREITGKGRRASAFQAGYILIGLVLLLSGIYVFLEVT